MSRKQTERDEARSHLNELENHVVDEFLARHIDRREFIRRATVLGIALPTVALFAEGATAAHGSAERGRAGGTVRLGVTKPGGVIDPVTARDPGTDVMIAQTGEYLAASIGSPALRPILATSWKGNPQATVWTFKIRQGVKFNDQAATPMTARDVAATFNRLADPANKSNALSALGGVLSAGAASAPDVSTVVFELDAPYGNFPWLVSLDNYNAIILPANYSGNWEKSFIGTGALKLDSLRPQSGARLVRNENYWGPKALPDSVEITFYGGDEPKLLALQARQVDAIDSFALTKGIALYRNPSAYTILHTGALHTELAMRVDKKPFTDARVRQAIGLMLDRPDLVRGLLRNFGTVGNDSPFAPSYVSTNRQVPQRKQNLGRATQLLAAAGYARGFEIDLHTWDLLETPQYAQIIQDAARKIGVDIKLVIQDSGSYFGKAVYGSSPWLDSTMTLTAYGHRGVPNVILTSTLTSKGSWNASHFRNKEYDRLVASYIKEVDLQSQRRLAGQIGRLLLAETPYVVAYYNEILMASVKSVKGVRTGPSGQIWVDRATRT